MYSKLHAPVNPKVQGQLPPWFPRLYWDTGYAQLQIILIQQTITPLESGRIIIRTGKPIWLAS